MRLDPLDLLDQLAAAWARRAATLQSDGFEPIRRAWLARAARLGQTITARSGDVTRSGQFETVDATGALVLQTPEGRRAIAAADVYF